MCLTVYTNEDNPVTLKILIAHNLSKNGETIHVAFHNPHDRIVPEPRHLPSLVVNSDLTFFSSNAAILYFLPPPESISAKIYDWLEWEANKLSPALANLGGYLKNEGIKINILNLLKNLDKEITNQYIIGEVLTAADISIWSLLYPMFRCQKTKKEFLTNLSNITKWFENLQSLESFEHAVNKYTIKEDITCVYNALAAGAKYLTPSSSNVQTTDKFPDRKEKDSPQHTVESISEDEITAAQKAWEKSINQLPKLKQQQKEVLPAPGEKNILITSALPYVNNVPHLGNIIGCVLSADVFARFSRLCNYNTLYICGTDEYGTATETKALEEGLSCKEICDKYFKIHSEIYNWFNISFDHFGRTSNKEQTELCQDIFLQLNDNGFMFTQSVDQLHCVKCDRYLADRFVEGGCPNIGCTYEDARGDQCDGCGKLVNAVELKNPRCKICKNTPKLKTSTQFFIDLPKIEPLLHHWVKISSPGWTNNAQVIARSWLKEGLKPRCITRDLKWGVPVPLNGYQNKVFYVWFDAPIGYMSISKAYTENFKKWWQATKDTEVTLYQFMAKDNVPFHAVLFPSMLLGCNRGYTTVSHIMATEYLNYEDGKFSKSRGVGVFGNDAQSTGIPSDVWRFYLLYVRPESQDSSFSWSDLVTKNNSELLNNLGNFINRALVFAKNNFNNTIPEMRLNKDDYTLLALSTKEYKGYVTSLEKGRLRDGIRHILSISRHGNQYMQSNQPWVLLKGTDEEKLRAGTVVGICCNLACLLATLLQPYMPDTSANLKKQLNTKDVVIIPENIEIVNLLPTGHKLGEPSPLFAKIDVAKIEELKQKFAGSQNDRKNNHSSDSNIGADVKIIEGKIAKQADKVRKLKSSGVEKSVWQPEVAILLDLKKKLELAQKKPVQPSMQSIEDVKQLEEEIAKQGDKVRKLKSSGAEKSIWQPEVAILLDLKKKLETAQKSSQSSQPQTTPIQNNVANAEEVKLLEQEVSKQGALVRKLKEGGADKTKWQPEVNKLLALKNQLAAAAGISIPTPQTKSKKK